MNQNRKVLVACATYAGKELALDDWIKAYNAYTYEPKFAYMVDNTRGTEAYAETVRSKGVECDHIEPYSSFEDTYRHCWELILKKAKELDCYWVYSVEADNVPAPESLQTMHDWIIIGNGELGGLKDNVHIVTHAYPLHKASAEASNVLMDSFKYHEMGCMLMSRQVLELALYHYFEHRNIPMAIDAVCKQYVGKHLYIDGAFEVLHLDTYKTEFPQFPASIEDSRLVNPTPIAPPDYGTEVPPSLRKKGDEN